jgi:hypothetical protein
MPGKGWFVIVHLYLTAVGAIITIVETIEGSQLAWSDLHTARRSTAGRVVKLVEMPTAGISDGQVTGLSGLIK